MEELRSCRSKLNVGNLIRGINAWAVVVVWYSAGIVDWTINELVNMDRRTRKILAMHDCLHTRSNVARLYLPRNQGGRGLIGIDECVKRKSKSLYGYTRHSTERMLQMVLKEKVLVEEENLQNYQRRRKEEEVRNWKEKALHGEFVWQTSDVAGEELRNGSLKKGTEGLTLATQEQALRTNLAKQSIDKTSETPLCRLCKDSTEAVWYIVSG